MKESEHRIQGRSMYVESQLEEGALSKGKELFFTFLTEQFFLVSDCFKKVLEKRFNKDFEPIYVVSCRFSRNRSLKNYVLINSGPGSAVEVNLEYEDLNRIFSESEIVQGLVGQILKRQKRIFLLPFTTNGLRVRNKRVILVGPKPRLSKKLSDKVWQFRMFKRLGLPVKDSEYFRNFEEMKNALARREFREPLFISASCSEGGDGNYLVRGPEDLDFFSGRMRGLHIFGTNRLRADHPFIVSKCLDITSSPNVNAIICSNDDVRILCFSEQIMEGSKYLGNIYPARIGETVKSEIECIMLRLGRHMAKMGYRGVFGCDFIVTPEGKAFIVDLNPRRQTSYLPLLLMLGTDKLLEIELDIALGKSGVAHELTLARNIVWAHRRMGSKAGHFMVREAIRINHETYPFENKGSEFAEIYFPENKPIRSSMYGYCLVTGDCREKVISRLEQKAYEIASHSIQPL